MISHCSFCTETAEPRSSNGEKTTINQLILFFFLLLSHQLQGHFLMKRTYWKLAAHVDVKRI